MFYRVPNTVHNTLANLTLGCFSGKMLNFNKRRKCDGENSDLFNNIIVEFRLLRRFINTEKRIRETYAKYLSTIESAIQNTK